MSKGKEINVTEGDLIGIKFVGSQYGNLVKYYIVTKVMCKPGDMDLPNLTVCSCSQEYGDFFSQSFSNVYRICEHNGRKVVHMEYVD